MSLFKKSLALPATISIIALVYMILGYMTLMLQAPYLDIAIEEDGFFEYVSFLGLFTTAILFLMAFGKSRKPENRPNNPPLKQLSYLALALLFIFGAGEEISWGQRLFGIETPQLLHEENVQNEINIHNLAIFRHVPITMETLFSGFAFTFTLVIPFIASRSSSFNQFANRIMPVPTWSLGLLFVANFMLAKLAKIMFVSIYQSPSISFVQAVQEIKESHYAFLFVIVAAHITFILQKTRGAPAIN